MDAVTANSKVRYAQLRQPERGPLPAGNQVEEILERLPSIRLKGQFEEDGWPHF